MDKGEIIVGINVKMSVEKKMAETCLRIVEMYINSSPVRLIIQKSENGETELRYESAAG